MLVVINVRTRGRYIYTTRIYPAIFVPISLGLHATIFYLLVAEHVFGMWFVDVVECDLSLAPRMREDHIRRYFVVKKRFKFQTLGVEKPHLGLGIGVCLLVCKEEVFKV